MSDCIFCKIAGNEIPTEKIYENEFVIAIKDINPVAKVHVLIMPKKHFDNILAVDGQDAVYLAEIQKAVLAVAEQTGIANGGFRLINNCGENGGQTVQHLHFHLIGGEKLGIKLI